LFRFFREAQTFPKVEKKFSSDAYIYNFIEDLALLFCNKLITYLDVGEGKC